jgi:hypothetical protein
MNFYITQHCKDRYLERVMGGKNTSNNLLMTIFKDLKAAKNITSQISTEVPRFILYLKQRYGTDKGYNIFRLDNIIFIATKRKRTKNLYDVVTCYIDIDSINKFKNTILTNKDIHLKLAMI